LTVPEILLPIFKWGLVALAVSPIVIGIGWEIVEGSLLPKLIPHKEIERLADDLIRRYPSDPQEAAFVEEQAAWCRSKSYDQGKWHRVRKLIRQKVAGR
jgi:hypothetical protein